MKKLTVFLIFIFSIFLRLWNLNAMGRTWDEALYINQGYHYIGLIKKRDFQNFYWIKEPDNPIFSKYFYGLLGHLDVQSFTKNHEPIYNYDFTYARFASILFTSFAIVFVVLVGWEFFSPFVGIVSGLILSMNPTILAISQIAGIDSPRLFFAAGILYLTLKFLEKPSNKKVFFLGLFLGFSLITRFSDIIFFPMAISVFVLWNFMASHKNVAWINKKYLFWFLLGFIQMVVVWPQPWFHIKYMIDLERQIRFTYVNSPWEWFMSFPVHVPVFYFAVHFLVRTPAGVLFLLCVGIWKFIRKRNWLFFVMALWFVIPFLQSFYPYKQHGIRYLIEIYIPVSIVAGVGLQRLINICSKKPIYKFIGIMTLFVYMFVILIRITPYYFDFFNIFVGGAKGVYDNHLFEIGWWGQGGREAGEYIIKHAPKGAKIGYKLNPFSALIRSDKLSYFQFNRNNSYDFVVTNYYEYQKVGYNNFESRRDYYTIKKNYKLVYTVYADGAELYHVYQSKK